MKRNLILVGSVLLLAAAALAAPPPPLRAEGAVLSPEQLAQFLGLTDAQKAQARLLADTMRATIAPIRDQLHMNRQQVDAAIDAGNAQRAGELLIASKALRDQIKAAHDNFKSSFESILSAEQKAKFEIYSEIVDLRRDDDRE